MYLEKQLTRIFKENNDETSESEEKAISVISREAVRFTGSAINKYDIMNNPGLNIISVKKVGDHLISLTPYSIFVNQGGANAHNTKEYSIDYTMLGNTHHICTNNKDTIMHTVPNNKVVQFIQITEDGINEINITPCQNATIYNSWCLYDQGNYAYYLLTDAGIYYLMSTKGVMDYTGDWTLVTDSTKSYATTSIYYSDNEPIIYSDSTRTNFVVSIRHNSNTSIISYEYTTYAQSKTNGLIPSTNKPIVFSLGGLHSYGIFTFQNIGYYIKNSYSYFVDVGLRSITEGTSTYYKYVFSIYQYVNSTGPKVLVSRTQPEIDLKYSSSDQVYLFNQQGMTLPSLDEEDTNTVYNNGDLWIVKGSKAYKFIVSFNTATPALTVVENGTIQLHNKSNVLFNPEPPFCFRLKARDVGDEIVHTEKIVYYNTLGQLDFFTGDYNIHGMFYNFKKFITAVSTTSNLYDVRKRVDKTSIMKKIKKGVFTKASSYTGTGEVTNSLIKGLRDIPYMIKIHCSTTSTLLTDNEKNNSYSEYYDAELYPLIPYGSCNDIYFGGNYTRYNYDSGNITYTKESDNTYTINIKKETAEQSLNLSGATYSYTVYYKEGVSE